MNRFIFATIALLLTAVVAGCNTVQGFGQDMKAAGHSIEKAATK